MNKEFQRAAISVKESNRSLGNEGLVRRPVTMVAAISNSPVQTEERLSKFEDRFLKKKSQSHKRKY